MDLNRKCELLEKMVLDLANTMDYDRAKYYDPEISEDPEDGRRRLDELIRIAYNHVDNFIKESSESVHIKPVKKPRK